MDELELTGYPFNCVRVMGRGIAHQFKHAFPANFEAYAVSCKQEEVRLGRMLVFETGGLTKLIRRYLGGLLDPFVILFEVHKLAPEILSQKGWVSNA
jgi:hypothetical protein